MHRKRTRTCTVISMIAAMHRIRRYQHPKVSCRSRGMTYRKVCIFEPSTVCWQESWQGDDQYPAPQLMKEKNTHTTAQMVYVKPMCLPYQQRIVIVRHRPVIGLVGNWPGGGIRRGPMDHVMHLNILIIEPDHTCCLNDCASIIRSTVDTRWAEKNIH